MTQNKGPLIYSCSGCSSAAQTANAIAIALDRLKFGEMSCVAGLGGDVTPLVKLAKSGRPIVALDGCALACAAQCLKRHGLKPDLHYVLSSFGVKKKNHEDFDKNQSDQLTKTIAEEIKAKIET